MRTEDFELGDFDRVQILPTETVLDAELEERAADAGQKGIEFIRRLRAISGMGNYIMLNRNGFTFSMEDFRRKVSPDFKNFSGQVFKEFCDVYGFAEMNFS